MFNIYIYVYNSIYIYIYGINRLDSMHKLANKSNINDSVLEHNQWILWGIFNSLKLKYKY